ncbi:MAG: CBS domain-containing protein [Deltaproteobacteria bacterium]|nr:CBS domain-containing protein [Deltaproteobacteria bacterium]
MGQRRAPSDGFPSEEDLFEALGDLPGYLDITPGDLGKLYRLAWRHAVDRLNRERKARDVMTREVLAVERATPLREVAEAMSSRGVSGVPVVDKEGRVVGVLSEKDFFRRLAPEGGGATAMSLVAEVLRRCAPRAVEVGEARAEDLMTSPAVTIGDDIPLGQIVELFRQRSVNRLPVVDADERLVGIVSRGDLIGLAVGGAP